MDSKDRVAPLPSLSRAALPLLVSPLYPKPLSPPPPISAESMCHTRKHLHNTLTQTHTNTHKHTQKHQETVNPHPKPLDPKPELNLKP